MELCTACKKKKVSGDDIVRNFYLFGSARIKPSLLPAIQFVFSQEGENHYASANGHPCFFVSHDVEYGDRRGFRNLATKDGPVYRDAADERIPDLVKPEDALRISTLRAAHKKLRTSGVLGRTYRMASDEFV